MQLYTLTRGFFPREFISEFTSAIWTERYSSAGDVQLVVPPIPSMIKALLPGTMLGLRGVKEVMMLENQSIENGLLTVTGSSLPKYLNQREAWFENPAYDGSDTTVNLSADYSNTDKIGSFLADVVNRTVINPTPFGSYWAPINLDWANEKIPGLALGRIDPNGSSKLLSFPQGPLYDGITQLATAEAEGFKLYLESAKYSTGTYVLRFATYRGKDRTSDQTANLMVRFSPQLDSLTNVKEVSSETEYKNTVYVFYKNQVTVHYIPTLTSTPTGFDRRSIRVDAPDIYLDAPHIPPFLEQVARDALATHLYVQAVDGQVSSKNDYVFGTDYYLGDIIELEGFSGLTSKARVTEYIRSQDQFGEQEYPTLSVIDPIGTNYIPDTEPTDFTPDWEGTDPDWTDDWTMPDVSVPATDPFDPRIGRTPSTPSTFPSDPYDFNPDPVVDFGPVDGNGDGGGDDGGGGDGGPGAGDIGLTPITSWQVASWLYDTDTGYYVHHGTAYVIGAASANGVDWFGSTLLLTNIPAGIRPSSSVSSKVLIDHVNSTYEYAYDSGLHIGPWLDVTVHPDGTVTLDDGNPFRAAGSSDNYVYLSLILSSISWPTSNVTSDSYAPTGSLTDYVATSAHILAESGNVLPTDVWANVDGHYAAHEGRFHLDGKVKVVSSEWAESYDPLIGIPVMYQPKQAAGTSDWCEVPQKDGYRQIIYPPSGGYRHALSQSGGAQNPQAAGNGGCGFHKHVFYARHSDGYVSRGSNVELLYEPRLPDVDLYPIGCSGSPIGSLPSIADWRGMTYSATVRFKPNDLIHTPDTVGIAKDLSAITGTSQFCFLLGLTPDAESYYKVVFTWDPAVGKVSIRVILEGGYPSERASLMEVAYVPSLKPDGTTELSWVLDISTNPGDTGYGGAILTGNYWRFTGTTGFASDAEDKVGMPAAKPGGKGDMGINIPSGTSCKVLSAEIDGIGTFPKFADNDVIDLTGCGWPLT